MLDEMFIHAIDYAYTEMKDVLTDQKRIADEFASFYSIGTMLHWTMDCVERLWPDDKDKYSEFKFAHNQMKHNSKIIKLHAISGGLVFPPEGIPFGVIDEHENVIPMHSFPVFEVVWCEINENKVCERYRKRIPAYRNNLQGKNVLDSLTNVYNAILIKYSLQ